MDSNRSYKDQLVAACSAGHLDVVKSLIDHVQSSSRSYVPPYRAMLKAAACHNQPHIARYCLEAGADPSSPEVLRQLVSGRSFETFQELVSAGLDVNEGIPWFGDFLIIAARSDNVRWARFCLEHGADPNLHVVDDAKKALAAAAEYGGSVEMAALLLDHDAQLDGSGAMVLAAESGRLEMVQYLLERGAKIDEIGLRSLTDPRETADMGSALHKAVTEGHVDVVHFLLDRGADLHLPDYQGRTPLVRAKERGEAKMIKVLEARGARE
ncbi:MAG: hypothetical protein M1826_006077 [Phylliscum demangeonii]|nr:MAG: hypothetical protein M1826_006077 [Phylliscum demangeonii]